MEDYKCSYCQDKGYYEIDCDDYIATLECEYCDKLDEQELVEKSFWRNSLQC